MYYRLFILNEIQLYHNNIILSYLSCIGTPPISFRVNLLSTHVNYNLYIILIIRILQKYMYFILGRYVVPTYTICYDICNICDKCTTFRFITISIIYIYTSLCIYYNINILKSCKKVGRPRYWQRASPSR